MSSFWANSSKSSVMSKPVSSSMGLRASTRFERRSGASVPLSPFAGVSPVRRVPSSVAMPTGWSFDMIGAPSESAGPRRRV